MKLSQTNRFVLVAVAASGLLALASCNSDKKASQETAAAVKANEAPAKLPPQRSESTTVREDFKVKAVDKAKREVTLQSESGAVATFQCGDEVRNFDQINVGDTVKAEVTEMTAIFVRKAGAPPTAQAASVVGRAPKGSKPAALVVDAAEVTARIEAVDPAAHRVTVTGPLGKLRVLQVNPNVDLSSVKVGDEVVVQYSQTLSILVVEHP